MRGSARFVGAALAAFLVTRVVALVAAHITAPPDYGLVPLLADRWDPRWYVDIAAHGFDDRAMLSPSLRVECTDTIRTGCRTGAPDRYSNLAFFTLFPALIRLLASLGIDPMIGAVVLASVAGFIAAALIALIAREVADDRVGLITVVLWGAMPANVVLSSARPETLFVAFAAGALLLLMRRSLMGAAALAALAGLTRFQAVAVVVPVVLAAWLWPLRLSRRIVASLLAVSGVAASLVFVAVRTGRADGWFAVQRAWLSTSDWGMAKWDYVVTHLGVGSVVHQVAAVTVVAGVGLLLACLAVRLPWPLILYSAILVAGVIVQARYHQHSMRFLLVAFPLVIPVAWSLRRLPNWLLMLVLAALLVLSAAFQSPLWNSGIDF